MKISIIKNLSEYNFYTQKKHFKILANNYLIFNITNEYKKTAIFP